MRTFTHDRMIDPSWVPAPDQMQTYRNGPKALCVVTKATATTVYYRYADSPHGSAFSLDRRAFEARFPGVLKRR